jgi:hypothetical protein
MCVCSPHLASTLQATPSSSSIPPGHLFTREAKAVAAECLSSHATTPEGKQGGVAQVGTLLLDCTSHLHIIFLQLLDSLRCACCRFALGFAFLTQKLLRHFTQASCVYQHILTLDRPDIWVDSWWAEGSEAVVEGRGVALWLSAVGCLVARSLNASTRSSTLCAPANTLACKPVTMEQATQALAMQSISAAAIAVALLLATEEGVCCCCCCCCCGVAAVTVLGSGKVLIPGPSCDASAMVSQDAIASPAWSSGLQQAVRRAQGPHTLCSMRLTAANRAGSAMPVAAG